MTRRWACRLVVVFSVVAAVGCEGENRDANALIRIDGSSTVFLLSEAVAEEFQASGQEGAPARVIVGTSGTGGGFQRFCRGETDINDASRPIRPAEIDACRRNGVEFIELPVAYDGIAIIVHPEAEWIEHITVAELRRIWAPESQGAVTRWSQVRPGWPDAELHLYGAGVDSGTYDYFTEAIVGTEGSSRGDFTASEDDNVLVQGVASDRYALGFLPFAYYAENRTRLKVVPVDNERAEDGEGAIAPSVETIRNGTYQPLARPLFIYVSQKALSRPEVQQFVDFYLDVVGELAEEVGYVPLSDRAYEAVGAHFARRRTGTLFGEGGSQVGITIEELLAIESK
jgi:phosphate transport system substrate-binding protein